MCIGTPNVDVAMSISVTCVCGARLEIDEKFLGKEIPCPDCQRPLPTKTAVAPPPLELPDNRHISALAPLSLAVGLVGAFTIIGSLIAIGLGWLALKQIARRPGKLEGTPIAKAGMIVGGVGLVLTLAALLSPVVFGIDRFLREMAMGPFLTYPTDDRIEAGDVTMNRPGGGWGQFKTPNTPGNLAGNALILYNVHADAYIGCQIVEVDGGLKNDELEKKVLEQVFKSELIDRAGRLKAREFAGDWSIAERKALGNKTQELTVDLVLAGIPRRLLIRYTTPPDQAKSSLILVGCARANTYPALEDEFRKSFDSWRARQ